MMNLLEETLNGIKQSGHTVGDISFIGSANGKYSCTWEEFKLLANRNYDAGFGSPKVAQDLIIVFSDSQQMWRHEYDGSECWRYSVKVTPCESPKTIKSLFAVDVGWEDLEEIQDKLNREIKNV